MYPTSTLIVGDLGEVEDFYAVIKYKHKGNTNLIIHSNS